MSPKWGHKSVPKSAPKNLSTFSELISMASLFVPGIGQMKGVKLLLKSIKKMKQINKAYKDGSQLYKMYVSKKDSEIGSITAPTQLNGNLNEEEIPF